MPAAPQRRLVQFLRALTERFKRLAPERWRQAVARPLSLYVGIPRDRRTAVDWCQLGRWLRHRPGRRQESLEAFRTASRLDPRLAKAWYEMGMWLATREPRRRGDRREALGCFRKALALDPDSAEACSAIGHLLRFRPGQLDAAQAMFDRARRLAPDRFLERLNARWATRLGMVRPRPAPAE